MSLSTLWLSPLRLCQLSPVSWMQRLCLEGVSSCVPLRPSNPRMGVRVCVGFCWISVLLGCCFSFPLLCVCLLLSVAVCLCVCFVCCCCECWLAEEAFVGVCRVADVLWRGEERRMYSCVCEERRRKKGGDRDRGRSLASFSAWCWLICEEIYISSSIASAYFLAYT